MDHEGTMGTDLAFLGAEVSDNSNRAHRADVIERYFNRRRAEKIVEAYSLADKAPVGLEKQMYGLDPILAREGQCIVESLNGRLIDRACKEAIDLGRQDVSGWLFLRHCPRPR